MTIRDDVCTFIKEKVKGPFVGPKSKKFPKGFEVRKISPNRTQQEACPPYFQIGMFSSACGSKEKWHFTGLTHG